MASSKLLDRLRRIRDQAEERSASLQMQCQPSSGTVKSDGEQESSIFTAPTTSTRGTKTAPVQSRTELQKVMNETPAKKQNSAEIVEKRAVVRKCLPPIEDSPVATSCTPADAMNLLPKCDISEAVERARNREIRMNSGIKKEKRSISAHEQPVCSKSALDVPTPKRSDTMPKRNAARHIVVNKRKYIVIDLIGKGGSSKVYQVLDEVHKKILAVKCVDLADTDEASRTAYLNEIKLLIDLKNTGCVVEMFDYELRGDCLLMVMEKGEIDLATFLRTRSSQIDGIFIRFYWSEMLKCVRTIHERGIVHSDLKPANFLLVGGNLKLIDFGIASSIPSNRTSIVKESQMGTLSYMPPEAIVSTSSPTHNGKELYKVQKKSDVWALGCILYNMVYGRTPYQNYMNAIQKTHAIVHKPITFQEIEDKELLDVMKKCLTKDPTTRASVEELLRHPYLTRKNVALDESVMLPGDNDLLRVAEDLRNCTPRTSAMKLGKLLKKKAKSESQILDFGNENQK